MASTMLPLTSRSANIIITSSSEDYLNYREQQRLNGPRAKPLSETTERGMKLLIKRWTMYATSIKEDPDILLQHANFADLTTFFKWTVDQSRASGRTRAPQAVSLKQYFRLLIMWREREGYAPLDDKLRVAVNSFIDFDLDGKGTTANRKKNVMSHVDFLKILSFHWNEDPSHYPTERGRLQFAMLLLIHAFSATRPCSTTDTSARRAQSLLPTPTTPIQDNCIQDAPCSANSFDKAIVADQSKIKSQNMVASKQQGAEQDKAARAIRYKDVDILMVRHQDLRSSSGTPWKFAMRIRFRHWKGELRKPQPKEFIWFQCSLLMVCPVTHMMALAIHDGAFLIPELNDPTTLLSLSLDEGRNEMKLSWRPECLEMPILRECDGSQSPLRSKQSSYLLRRLGENMGLPHTLCFYDIRRGVSNAIDGMATAAVRNQILGHADGATFDHHYLNPTVRLDVQNTFLQQPTEDALLHSLTHMNLVIDPNVPRALPTEIRDLVEGMPDMQKLFAERAEVRSRLASLSYGDDCSDDPVELLDRRKDDIERAIRSLRATYQRQAYEHYRRKYFEQKDNAIIEAQLAARRLTTESAPTSQSTFEPGFRHVLSERSSLAEMLSSPALPLSDPKQKMAMSNVLQAMVSLCNRREGAVPRNRRRSNDYGTGALSEPVLEASTLAGPNIRVHKLQCLFCIGDQMLAAGDRQRCLSSRQRLWDHVDNHLKKFAGGRSVPCPHPACNGLVLTHVAHFKSHALTTHGSRLRPAV